jgi:hypothetical protein
MTPTTGARNIKAKTVKNSYDVASDVGNRYAVIYDVASDIIMYCTYMTSHTVHTRFTTARRL